MKLHLRPMKFLRNSRLESGVRRIRLATRKRLDVAVQIGNERRRHSISLGELMRARQRASGLPDLLASVNGVSA